MTFKFQTLHTIQALNSLWMPLRLNELLDVLLERLQLLDYALSSRFIVLYTNEEIFLLAENVLSQKKTDESTSVTMNPKCCVSHTVNQ